ncbi:hypothetical protein OEZ85_008125 [Tetradesmus obliquus]|uniref:FANCL UBC-like domain-containing protein n=1 Tax=Tetradesmus obliquus TaxID=3088 RepID=A0ABY8TI84_TETOB|nr:hypothetical protein OEZ85_008125 [Tetradesmus obliquus]
MSPAQYLPPWSFAPTQQEAAFRNLLRQLEELHATVLNTDTASTDGEYYILAQLPTGGGSSSYDTVQIKLRPDGVALFKSEAARSTPDPPFCLTPGCISGPRNRQRMEALRDALGWAVLETDEDKAWVQILLH